MNSLEEKVLRILGEDPDDPDVFTDSNIDPIRDSINDAIEEIAVLSGSDKVTYKVPLYAGMYLYRLYFPQHQLAWIDSVYLPEKNRQLAQGSIGSVERESVRFLSSSNTPMTYYTLGVDVVGFYPMFGTDGYHANLKCTIVPKAYTTETAIIKLREERETAVISYAVGEYYLSVGDMDRAVDYLGRYSSFVSTFNFTSHMSEKWSHLRGF